MYSRKCVYTGEKASCRDKVIPHNGGDIDHNWSNTVPCSRDYKDRKSNKMPTELEMKISRAFYELELSKKEVEFWQAEHDRLKGELETELKVEPPKKKKNTMTKKDKEIELAYKEKEIVEMDLDSILEKNKKKLFY